MSGGRGDADLSDSNAEKFPIAAWLAWLEPCTDDPGLLMRAIAASLLRGTSYLTHRSLELAMINRPRSMPVPYST